MTGLNLELFLAVFSFIFLAELPDKTALTTLLMATRSRPLPVFLGVALAFVVQSLVAIFFGSLLGRLPTSWVHLGTGLLFMLFAVQAWRTASESSEASEKNSASPDSNHFWKIFGKSFLVIFIAEWGDLTQLATISFAAHSPQSLGTIFFASTLALWCVTGIAVLVGHRLKHLINVRLLGRASAIAFLLVGFYFIFSFFPSAN